MNNTTLKIIMSILLIICVYLSVYVCLPGKSSRETWLLSEDEIYPAKDNDDGQNMVIDMSDKKVVIDTRVKKVQMEYLKRM